jgi:hypothetical protein
VIHLATRLGRLAAHHLTVEHRIHLLEGVEKVVVKGKVSLVLGVRMALRMRLGVLSTCELIWQLLVLTLASKVGSRMIDLGLASAI